MPAYINARCRQHCNERRLRSGRDTRGFGGTDERECAEYSTVMRRYGTGFNILARGTEEWCNIERRENISGKISKINKVLQTWKLYINDGEICHVACAAPIHYPEARQRLSESTH